MVRCPSSTAWDSYTTEVLPENAHENEGAESVTEYDYTAANTQTFSLVKK